MIPAYLMKALTTGHRGLPTLLFNAVTRRDVSHGALVQDVPVPKLENNEMLVRVHYVALNPTDWKHIDFLSPPKSIIGCDYSGTVEVLPDNPEVTQWKVGDRVAGAVHGGLYKDKGSFAEFIKVEPDLCFRVPETRSMGNAAAYGVSCLTAMQALCLRLDFPWPYDDSARAHETARPSILVYGGSTTAGLMTIQQAERAGYTVVATCSPRNFELCQSYGASQCFDYNSPGAAERIKAAFPDCRLALDCIAEGGTCHFCVRAVAPFKGDVSHGEAKIVTLLPPPRALGKTPNVKFISIMAYTLQGKEFQLLAPIGPRFPAVPEDRAGAVRFYQMFPRLIENGLRPPPIEELEGGFDGILLGLEKLRRNQVSGRKLVAKIS